MSQLEEKGRGKILGLESHKDKKTLQILVKKQLDLQAPREHQKERQKI